jgi:poly(3-hydroxybutyrate) depolymerase
MTVSDTVQTMGSKPADAADSKKGPWSYVREYTVTLPTGYDANQPYPLVFEGPGCGGGITNVLALTGPAAFNAENVNNTVIRVGVAQPPNDIGHATNPNQGCFDDHDGNYSVDWVLYETLYDKLAAQICFDKNRVFVTGHQSGAVFANELACKYAGDASRPIRAVLSDSGGLPPDPGAVPTCSTQPMAGIWAHKINDMEHPFTTAKDAIARAMHMNGCTVGTGYDDAMFENFSSSPANPDPSVCRKIVGCPPLYPLVVCPMMGSAQTSLDSVTNPGFSMFIRQLEVTPQPAP